MQRGSKPGAHQLPTTFLARGTVRVCRHPHHREHRPGHHPPAVHICLHRSPAFQGEALPGPAALPWPTWRMGQKPAISSQARGPQIVKANDLEPMVSKLGNTQSLCASRCRWLASGSLGTLAVVMTTVTHRPSYLSSHQLSSLHPLSGLSTASQPSHLHCCSQALQSMVLAGVSGIVHTTQEPLQRPSSSLIRS